MSNRGHGRRHRTRREPPTALALTQVRLPAVDRRLERDELRAHLEDADGLVCLLTEHRRRGLLAGAPWLRVVANVAVGYNNIDVPAATRRRIVVTNTPGVLTETTADFTALLLAIARRIAEADAACATARTASWLRTSRRRLGRHTRPDGDDGGGGRGGGPRGPAPGPSREPGGAGILTLRRAAGPGAATSGCAPRSSRRRSAPGRSSVPHWSW